MGNVIKVTAGVIYNTSQEILIAKRAEGKDLAGFWEFPGGKVEAGEDPEQCLLREINEELGLKIKIIRHFMDTYCINGDKRIILMAYLATTDQKEVYLKDHDEVKWVRASSLKCFSFAPADRSFVKEIEAVGESLFGVSG